MTQLTIETQVKLGMLIGSMKTAEGRIHSLRTSIAKREQQYKELCRGFARGEEPAEPIELAEERLELISVVQYFNELSQKVNDLEDKTFDEVGMKVISKGKKTAMVILTGKDEITGKKVSITRHLQLVAGTSYTGKSLFGHRTVRYELQSFVEEKAA